MTAHPEAPGTARRAVFGYGSLVNRATHGFGTTRGAEVIGWRRGWRCIEGLEMPLLTAIAAPGARLQGLIAEVPEPGWAGLDAREQGYACVEATADEPGVMVYAVPEADFRAPQRERILLSYLDAVLQGFAREFGPGAVEGFMASTDGWVPVLDDRAAPRYPRHQRLSAEEQALIDAALKRHRITVLPG